MTSGSSAVICESDDNYQWNLSNTDTIGPLNCVLIRGVSPFQGCRLGGVALYLDLIKCPD